MTMYTRGEATKKALDALTTGFGSRQSARGRYHPQGRHGRLPLLSVQKLCEFLHFLGAVITFFRVAACLSILLD